MEDTSPRNAAADFYGLAPSDLQPLRGGLVSQVFGFRRDGRDYILRLSPPQAELDLDALRAVHAWTGFLARHGARVPELIPSSRGNLIESFSQPDGEWLAIVQTRAPGVLSEELPLAHWDAALFEALGRAVGKLHAVAGEYRPAAELRRPDWEEGENLFRSPTFADPNLAALAAAALERIRGLPQGPENYGMIHADLHFANFYVDVPARSITVFDFDDCCYGWYVMDLAVLLFDVLVLYEGPDREAFALDFMHSLLKGYRHEWTTDLAGMADFLKLLEVNMFGTLAPRYQPGQGWWSSRFMPGRGEAIQAGRPYVPLDFAGL